MKYNESSELWFTSDTHFGHANIIRYSNRPYSSAAEMDADLIEKWNSVVKYDDLVFHLGDFCFGGVDRWEEIRDQLNGEIILIRGNHDKLQNGQIRNLFSGVYDYLKIQVYDEDASQNWQDLILSHYSFRVWDKSHRGSFQLYGHSHGSLPDDPNARAFDCGVDCHNYTPISYAKVKEIMLTKNFKPIDHHGS